MAAFANQNQNLKQEQERMRLLTHNLLECHVKNCKNNYPLILNEVELEETEQEYSEDFIQNMLSKLDLGALKQTALSLGIEFDFELTRDADKLTTENYKALHSFLLERRILAGNMTCPGCGHVFPIKNGIPNMLLNENEV